MVNKIQVLIAGTPKTTVSIAQLLFADKQYEIMGILCPHPKPVGRKKILTACDLEVWAVSKSLPVFHVQKESFSSPGFYAQLPSCDVLIVADFGFLLPKLMLEHAKHGAINVHPSLLPRWRGASPVPFSIVFGDEHVGVTLIQMNQKFDQGHVLAQYSQRSTPQDTTPFLLQTLFLQGGQMLLDLIPKYIAGKCPITPQSSPTTPSTRKFTKEDGYVSWNTLQQCMLGQIPTISSAFLQEYKLPTETITLDRLVRAFTPWPGVWTTLPNEKRMKVLQTSVSYSAQNQPTLALVTVQLEGKTPSSFSPKLLE